jgi:co-chaperonin GroES (HSP10)
MLKPIKNSALLELLEKDLTTESGIILKSDVTQVNKGLVLAIGPDVTDVDVGEIVLPNWNLAKKIKHEGKDLYIIKQDDIVGVYDNADNL